MTLPVRIEELLVERATQGLSPDEQRWLDGALAEHPEVDPDRYDLAAAAIDLALAGPPPALRPALRERLVRLGRDYTAMAAPPVPSAGPRRIPERAPARRRAPAHGWWAAAAALLLALAGWWPRLTSSRVAPGPAPATPAAELAALLEEPRAETRRFAWVPTGDEAASGAGGAVIWSGPRQRGYLEIRGLAPNDPAVEQYQLWIFDATRDERFPVDGGVFDVPPGVSEVIVPIDAGIEVREPVLFAVTVERPGGVVVSSRERIVLVAEPV